MTYLKVQWVHDVIDDPIWIYGELNDAGDELRKIEVFRDGAFLCVVLDGINYVNFGAEGPWPSAEEIASDPQFVVTVITDQEFETLWQKALPLSR